MAPNTHLCPSLPAKEEEPGRGGLGEGWQIHRRFITSHRGDLGSPHLTRFPGRPPRQQHQTWGQVGPRGWGVCPSASASASKEWCHIPDPRGSLNSQKPQERQHRPTVSGLCLASSESTVVGLGSPNAERLGPMGKGGWDAGLYSKDTKPQGS